MKRLRIPSKEELEGAFGQLLDWFTSTDNQVIEEYIVKLRAQHPGIGDDDLARKIVRRKSMKCGLVGAATGVPGVLLLPATIPTNLGFCWRIQIVMAVAVARVYGHTAKTTDLKTDVMLILVGDGAKEALKRFGIEVGKSITKKYIDRVVTREVMVGVWKVISQKVITKAGQKSLTSFMKLVPLVGAPIGFAFDYPAARVVGATAIKYYRGGG